MTFYYVFPSWLFIKVKQSSCFLIMFLIMFFFMFLVMIFYQMIFMFSRHNFLSNNLHVFSSCSLYVSFYVSHHDFLSNDLHVFSSKLSIKKIMQKSKKFLYLTLLTSSSNSWRIKLNWLNYQLSQIALNWKYA